MCVTLTVVTMSVIMLIVIMMSVVMMSVEKSPFCYTQHNNKSFMLTVVMLSVAYKSFTLTVVMLSVAKSP
jgi:hypothetical protein